MSLSERGKVKENRDGYFRKAATNWIKSFDATMTVLDEPLALHEFALQPVAFPSCWLFDIDLQKMEILN